MNTDDPVDRFFARERAAVEPFPTSEQHLQSMLAAVERQRRRRWVGAVASVAAVALVVTGVVWSLRQPSEDHTQVGAPGTGQMTGTLTAAATPSATASASGRDSASSPPSATPPPPAGSASTAPTPSGSASAAPSGLPAADGRVPADLRVGSVSNSGGGRVWSLGAAGCGAGSCPTLAASDDEGATWHLVHQFSDTAAGGLTSVRFASRDVGWVFGAAGALKTTDGGRTWATYGQPGGVVFDLSTDGADVVLVTGPPTPSDLTVLREPVSASRAVHSAGTMASTRSAEISWNQGKAFVTTSEAAVRVDVAGLTPVNVPSCTSAPRLVAPGAGSTLYAACPRGVAAGSLALGVYASTDRGRTWKDTVAPGGQPLLVANTGSWSLAASDPDHLLAASSGGGGSFKVSADGGRTWAAPASPPASQGQGWGWLGAPGAGMLYAVPADHTGSYWLSTDRGADWQQIRVAG